jgi:hypothetical protein
MYPPIWQDRSLTVAAQYRSPSRDRQGAVISSKEALTR